MTLERLQHAILSAFACLESAEGSIVPATGQSAEGIIVPATGQSAEGIIVPATGQSAEGSIVPAKSQSDGEQIVPATAQSTDTSRSLSFNQLKPAQLSDCDSVCPTVGCGRESHAVHPDEEAWVRDHSQGSPKDHFDVNPDRAGAADMGRSPHPVINKPRVRTSGTNTIELMVHPGFPSPATTGGCGRGPDDFAQSTDRHHEMNILQSEPLKMFLQHHSIQLVPSIQT